MSLPNIIFNFLLAYSGQFTVHYYIQLILGILFLFYLYFRLRTKTFYFVRHGETLLNEAHIKQDARGMLSERGVFQTSKVGRYLQSLGIQKIYASPYERTVQTATLINNYLKVPIVYSELLVERRNPSDVIGKSYFDLEVKKIIDLVDLSYHRDDFRYLDEENFEDLKKRARKCLGFLGNRLSHQVVVVTHGVFLKMLLSYMLHQGELHNSAYVRMSFFNQADNGGITICQYSPWKSLMGKNCGWKILSYNEQLTN